MNRFQSGRKKQTFGKQKSQGIGAFTLAQRLLVINAFMIGSFIMMLHVQSTAPTLSDLLPLVSNETASTSELPMISSGSVRSSVREDGDGAGSGGAAICAIQKWGVRYVDEWIDYHLALGFEKIYLYDNSDDFELQEWFKSRKDQTKIVIQHYPGEKQQMKAFSECGTSIREREAHEWIAFIDVDEYIVIRDTEKYPHIMDYLNTVPRENVGGLGVNWKMFGFNNQTKYEPKPLSLRFKGHMPETNKHIKTLARASVYKKVGGTPHDVEYVAPNWKTIDSNGNIVKGPFNQNPPSDVIVIFHYYTKSLEEYKERCKRGRAAATRAEANKSPHCVKRADWQILSGVNNETIIDDSVWKLLKERVPEYTRFETI